MPMPGRYGTIRVRRRWAATGEINGLVNGSPCRCGMVFDDTNVDPYLGRCRLDLGVAVRSAALRLRDPDHQGQVRRRAGVQVRRRDFVLSLTAGRTATGGMAQPVFFERPPSSTLAEIAALTKAHLVDAARGGQQVRGLASLDEAGPMHLTFFDNLKYADQLAATKAGACLVSERFEATRSGACCGAARGAAVPRVREDCARISRRRAAPAILVWPAPASRRPPSSIRARIWRTA